MYDEESQYFMYLFPNLLWLPDPSTRVLTARSSTITFYTTVTMLTIQKTERNQFCLQRQPGNSSVHLCKRLLASILYSLTLKSMYGKKSGKVAYHLAFLLLSCQCQTESFRHGSTQHQKNGVNGKVKWGSCQVFTIISPVVSMSIARSEQGDFYQQYSSSSFLLTPLCLTNRVLITFGRWLHPVHSVDCSGWADAISSKNDFCRLPRLLLLCFAMRFRRVCTILLIAEISEMSILIYHWREVATLNIDKMQLVCSISLILHLPEYGHTACFKTVQVNSEPWSERRTPQRHYLHVHLRITSSQSTWQWAFS